MKRLFSKVGRFFWSWGFLKFILWTLTIIVLLYVEEDWRGARDWAAAKARWEAQGESLEYSRLIPLPVPDGQNLATIPLFKLEPDPENNDALAPLALRKVYRAEMPGNNLSFHSGNWQAGRVDDMAIIRQGTANDYQEAFKKAPLPADPLVQFDTLYPFLAELKSEAALRPYCRFPHEYPPQPPYNELLALVTPQIQISRVLNAHALLALGDHRPDLALADIQTSLKIVSALTKEPFVVSGLVAIGMTAIGFSSIYDGLALHSWNDLQLVELQNDLAQIDFLSAYSLTLHGELGISIPNLDRIKGNRPQLDKLLEPHDGLKIQYPEVKSPRYDFLTFSWPDGWIDQNKAQILDADMEMVRWVDLKAHRVYPQNSDYLLKEEAKQQMGPAIAPWNIFATISYPTMVSSLQKFSLTQVWIDEARIVCALERYRLSHNAYPSSLDALAPAYIPELPHDIITGDPYRYRLRADGMFVLYSVGWNQKDEGGQSVYKKDAPLQIDYTQGDWVWPVPQAAKP